MKIGLLGGSFDPVHKGHLKLAREALRQLKLSRVYFILSPSSPFKLNHKQSSLKDRERMLRMALSGSSRFFFGRWELERKGPSFTVTTLNVIHRLKPNDSLYLILGSDLLKGFSRWRDPKKIFSLARVVVGRRPRHSIPKKIKYGPVNRLKGLFPDISSTTIRKQLVRKTKSSSLPPRVRAYIRKRDLYGTEP